MTDIKGEDADIVAGRSKYQYTEEFQKAYDKSRSIYDIIEMMEWSQGGAAQQAVKRICAERDLTLKTKRKVFCKMTDFPLLFIVELAKDCKNRADLHQRLYGLVPEKQISKFLKENNIAIYSDRHAYSKRFDEAVASSSSKQEVFRKLGWHIKATASYRKFDEYATKHNVDYSHFNNKKRFLPKLSDKEFFVLGKDRAGTAIKERLYLQGVKKECSMCGVTDWQGSPVSLEIDHIDGDRFNNLLNNLRILCPNCHATTDTYRAKNQGRYSIN